MTDDRKVYVVITEFVINEETYNEWAESTYTEVPGYAINGIAETSEVAHLLAEKVTGVIYEGKMIDDTDEDACSLFDGEYGYLFGGRLPEVMISDWHRVFVRPYPVQREVTQ